MSLYYPSIRLEIERNTAKIITIKSGVTGVRTEYLLDGGLVFSATLRTTVKILPRERFSFKSARSCLNHKQWSAITKCCSNNSYLLQLILNNHSYRVEFSYRNNCYILTHIRSAAKWCKVKWSERSEVEWGKVKCSIGKGGGGMSLHGKGL